MKIIAATCCLLIMAFNSIASPDPIVWWRLDKVIDVRTLRIRSEKDKVRTITLGCVGKATNEKKAIAFIHARLKGQRLGFCPLSTGQTNYYARPMCLIIDDIPKSHKGMREWTNHFPILNEELIAKGFVTFRDVSMPYDEYGLKARLRRAYEFRKDAEQDLRQVSSETAPSATSDEPSR